MATKSSGSKAKSRKSAKRKKAVFDVKVKVTDPGTTAPLYACSATVTSISQKRRR